MAAFVNPREEVPTSLCCSVTKSCPTPCNPAAHQASLSFTISLSLFKLMSFESVMPSNHLILCHPLLLLPLIFPSIRVFSNESALPIWCPKYGASTSALVLPKSSQHWLPLRLTGLISLPSKELFSNTTVQRYQFFSAHFSLRIQI